MHRGRPAHIHIGAWTLARRPLLVGAVHGLAGSGALTALVLTTLPTTAARLTYMALFGLGSTLGMAALSGLLGWPLARAWRNHARGRARRVAGRRLRLDRARLVWGIARRSRAHFTATVQLTGDLLRRIADLVVARLKLTVPAIVTVDPTSPTCRA